MIGWPLELRLLEERLIFKPSQDHEGDPSSYGLSHEDIWFQAADGATLHGWFFPGGSGITWVFFHGNTLNISHRLGNVRLLCDGLGVSVFIFDYRGYGRSEGRPSEDGVYLDGQAAVAWTKANSSVDPCRLVYFGRSLGAAVALETALSHPPMALILEAPFSSIRAMAEETSLGKLTGRLMRIKMDNLSKIGRLQAPFMAIHGDGDETVGFAHGLRLFRAAPEPKEFYGVPGGGHKDCFVVGGERYLERLRQFLRRVDTATAVRGGDPMRAAGTVI